jgi:putative ABC transport system ATP-binding protein
MKPGALVELKRVARHFDAGAIRPIEEVSLTVSRADCVSIVGPSGSGKSTLIYLMSGMDLPSAGTVAWKGQISPSRREWTRIRASNIGLVFQDFLLLSHLNALQNVELAVSPEIGKWKDRRDRAILALQQVGLADRSESFPYALSGGERQRVAVARALVNDPELVLADEPTGSLDTSSAQIVTQLLFDLQSKRGHALVLVTHELNLARQCARQIRLRDGRVEEGAC